jgi:hypothetical protein
MSQPAAGVYVELRALVEKFSQDMNGAVGTVTGAQKKIQGAMGTIQKVTQAALFLGGVVALKKLADGIGELANRGDEVSDVRANFESLGGTSAALESAKESILGVVSATELMKIANQGLMKDIPGYNENFGQIAKLGNQVADSLGIGVTEGIQQVTDALASGKVKQLEAIGVQLNVNAAYDAYAKKIGLAVNQLDKQQQKEALQIAAMGKLTEASSRFAEVGDSVAAAQDAVSRAMSEGLDAIGEAVNDNDALREAYRNLEEQLDEIDWKQVGADVAELAAIIIDKLGGALQTATKWLHEFKVGLDVFDKAKETGGDVGLAKALVAEEMARNKSNAAIFEAKEAYESLQKIQVDSTGELIANKEELLKAETAVKKLGEAVANSEFAARDYGAAYDVMSKKIAWNKVLLADSTEIAIKHGGKSAKALDDETKAAAKAAKAIKDLKDKWSEAVAGFNEKIKIDSLEKQIESAISSGDAASFEKLKLEMEDVVKDGFVAEWKEAIDSGAVSLEDVEAQGIKLAAVTGDELKEKWTEAVAKVAEEAKKQFTAAFDDVGSNLAGALEGVLPGIGNIFDTISSVLSDETKAGLMEGIASALGTDASGLAAYGQAASTALGAGLDAKATDKADKSNKGTGGAVGAVGGGAIGAVFGGPAGAAIGAQVGKFIGEAIGGIFKWGSQNPETQARHAFANFIEEGFAKLEQVSFFDAKGKLQNYNGKNLNFLEGSSDRFNTPGWADEMDKWGAEARATFDGLGKGMKEVLGLTEDVGSQIAFLLGENLAGNIDNARLLVQQLGLSFEEMEAKLVEAGKSGAMSWLEVETAIQGASEAFKPGLVAVGDMKGAMEQLVGSGGRGMVALIAVKNTAVEAMEAGAKSIEDMGQRMIAQGVDPTLVQDFMNAIRGRGIKTLEELAAASDRVAGGIVADVTAANEPLRKTFEETTQNVLELGEQIAALPDTKDVFINVKTNLDEGAKQLLNGELQQKESTSTVTVEPKTSAMKLEAKNLEKDAIGVRNARVTSRDNGKQSTQYNINVDARGSDGVGIEARVRRSIMELEPYLTSKAQQKVANNTRRGL